MKRKVKQQKPCLKELTIDFGPFSQPNPPPSSGIFQRVKSQMLKRQEKLAHRQKPFQFHRLELSLQQKLKQKAFNKEEQRLQLVMLEKCKNYFQMRKTNGVQTPNRSRTPKAGKRQKMVRPKTSISSFHSSSSSIAQQLQGVMDNCDIQQQDIKENMGLFTYYCKMMNRRLEGIKQTIQKKQRMI